MTAGADLVLPVERDHGLHLLRQLVRIRRFEERCVELYSGVIYPPQVALVGARFLTTLDRLLQTPEEP